MIVVDRRFVFVHLEKCGGTFVRQFLTEFFPERLDGIGYHFPIRMLPRRYRGLPVLGVVRNPWSYYHSLFHYNKEVHERLKHVEWSPLGLVRAAQRRWRVGKGTGVYVFMSDHGRLSFAPALERLLRTPESAWKFRQLERCLGRIYRPGGMNLIRADIRRWRGSQDGFLSYRVRQMFGRGPQVHLARLEHIASELPALLDRIGIGCTEAMREWLAQTPPVNRSTDGEGWMRDYDDALVSLVAHKDRALIERFGYTFEGER